jgi:peptide/nickel transport system substrate-binding protein
MLRLIRVALLAGLALMIAPPANAQPRNNLVVGMALEPPHLDPTAGAAAAIREVVYANLFEGLVRMDGAGAIRPALARSWTISPDGLVYTFTLAPNVRFHDGNPMTAEDVKFSFERAVAEGSVNAQRQLFEPIQTVEAVDTTTVRITLKRPTGHFLFNLTWGDMVIVGRQSAANNRATPVGTGPFRFARRVQGDRVELTRFDGYWGTAAALQSVTFRFISDPTASIAAMLAGDVDSFPNFPAPEALGALRADPRFRVVIGNTEGETILAMNNTKAPFNDVRVRRAISHAINRRAIIDGAMFGFGTPIGTHFSPTHPAYVDLTGAYAFDVARSRALLAEAGVTTPLRVTLRLPPPAYARRSGEIIQAQLRAVGIEVEILPVEWAQWLDQVFRNRDYDMSIVAHTEPMDIEIYARDTYYFNYRSDRLRETMAELTRTVEDTARNRLLQQAQRIITEDAVNVYMFMLPKIGVWNSRVQGQWEHSPMQANDVTGVRWAN